VLCKPFFMYLFVVHLTTLSQQLKTIASNKKTYELQIVKDL
jgi:hypothetical protein